MKTLLIQPAIHRLVRDPKNNAVLPEGVPTEVPASSYWLRRLRMGDVVIVEQARAPKKTKAPKEAETAAAKEE